MVTPWGSLSTMVTVPVVGDAPTLLAVSVYVVCPPALTMLTPLLLVRRRSTAQEAPGKVPGTFGDWNEAMPPWLPKAP